MHDRLTWRAGSDRVAHAHRSRYSRTLCGSPIVLERLAWPAFRRCRACESLAADLAPVPEGEARALWGSR